MGILDDIFGEGGFLRDAGDWVDDNVFGEEEQKTEYKTIDGRRVPVLQQPGKRDNFIGREIGAPMVGALEKALHGLEWLYSNGISQPISTFLMMGAQNENLSEAGNLFEGSQWSKTWTAANNISPGQALRIMETTDSAGARAVVNSPLLYASPAKSYLPPGWEDLSEDEQQGLLKGAGMPAIGNREIERLRAEDKWFSFASGSADFAARWWLDPLVMTGKGAAKLRNDTVVKPRPKGGWSKDDIDGIMADSTMGKAQDFLWANRDNPQLINNLSMFKKSALGPRAGGIISSLKSPEEVNLFLRTTLGDVEARLILEGRNSEAAYRLQQSSSRLANHELNLDRFQRKGQERHAAMVESRIDELTRQVNETTGLTERYSAMLAHYGELDAVNLTRFSFGRAERRTKAANAYRAGPALGTSGAERSALGKARIYARDFFGPSLVLVRAFKESHPNGLIAVDDIHPEAIDELRGHIARIPGVGPDIRRDLLDGYLRTTTEGERLAKVQHIQEFGVSQVAKKHGLSPDEAKALYREYQGRILGGQDRMRRYSAGTHPEIRGPEGEAIHLDEFLDEGGNLTVHPNLVTKLVNEQVMIDLKALDTTLTRHKSAFSALRTKAAGNPDWIVDQLDWFNHLWKFGTLFRLGYIPRVLGDDLAGQMARLGAATMAVRAGWGVKNLATNLAQWRPASHYQAQEAAAREGLKYIDDELKPLLREADYHRREIGIRQGVAQADARRARDRHRRAVSALNALPEGTATRTLNARRRLVDKRAQDVARAERQLGNVGSGKQGLLTQLDEHVAELQAQRAASLQAADGLKMAAERGFRQSSQTYRAPRTEGGVGLPAAFQGERGQHFQKMISSDDSLRTLLARNQQVIHSNLQRSYGNFGVAISYPQNPELFVSAWHKAINHQIMQDQLAKLAVEGRSIDEMTRWLTRTPQGLAYQKRLGLKYTAPERIAASAWHEVAEYMPTAEIKMAAREGKADGAFLREAASLGHHPLNIHTTQLGEALAGSNRMSRGLDRVTDTWYKWAASVPADRMSRHPLFNQLYEGHAQQLVAQELKQGGKIRKRDADDLAERARRLALKDTRKLVFDIAHRSDTAHMLRFMSPFFAATTEAWQRWARIIADKPQTVGYASVMFNAPVSLGWMQDPDGNRLMRDGTTMVWDEKSQSMKKRLVPKGERFIMARVPKFLAEGEIGKAFGLEDRDLLISQDSMNMVTQGDPFFNPGVGPIVSIPVNEFVKDKPSQGEVARHLGVLPFGPTAGSPLFGNTPLGRAADLSMPATIKNFLTAHDTSDERYQRVKLQIMQKAAYEHAAQGKPMPSAKEIANMTKQYWLDSAGWSFVQPFATQRPDKYQFFRDQYNALRRKDPLKADEEFLARFQESYFIFAQATSKNVVGAEATKAAVELSKKYEQQLAEHPELGALIIGPEGSGPFSPEAYTYQLTHPVTPGGSEMQRRKLSAEEAMKENERRLGWAKFSKMQHAVTAELQAAGFTSFEDMGAEEFKAKRGAIAKLYGEPLLPDGSENPYYNEEWSKDYHSFDARKADRMARALEDVASSDMAKEPARNDLRVLQTYLQGRKQVRELLEVRKATGAAGTLKAKANSDVAKVWAYFVDGLVEQDTTFGDLYYRYLSRDLGVDVDELMEALEEVA